MWSHVWRVSNPCRITLSIPCLCFVFEFHIYSPTYRTWAECADGLTAMPTFTKPFCSTPYRALAGGYGAQETPIADPRVIPTRTSTTATASSIITSAPPPDFFEVLRAKSHSGTQSCTPLMICEDGIAVCAGTTQMWGGYELTPLSAPAILLMSNTSAGASMRATKRQGPRCRRPALRPLLRRARGTIARCLISASWIRHRAKQRPRVLNTALRRIGEMRINVRLGDFVNVFFSF